MGILYLLDTRVQISLTNAFLRSIRSKSLTSVIPAADRPLALQNPCSYIWFFPFQPRNGDVNATSPTATSV